MNKKLEEWRDTKAAQSAHLGSQEHIGGFKTGFESCLALDLPVKFAEWKYDNIYSSFGVFYIDGKPIGETYQELFQYYLEHIHKFE